MCCAVLSFSVVSDSTTPWTVACQAPLSMWILQARILEWIAMPSSRRSFQPRDQTQVSCTAGSLPSELPGQPKNTGVGSLSLLQSIFLTQELNHGLLHCRQIPYQLSYQGSPMHLYTYINIFIFYDIVRLNYSLNILICHLIPLILIQVKTQKLNIDIIRHI